MSENETYLFFDVECSNCFDGIGKMCSFGYVLTDSSFNILESNDIVMNPESEFDWYLMKKGGTSLAYPEYIFRGKPNFKSFHAQIYALLKNASKVFAFSALNDVGFVVTACERYRLPIPNFCAFDVEKFCKKDDEVFGSLDKRCKILGIDESNLTAHKSSDDAVMTMLLLKAFLERESISAENLPNDGFVFSVADFQKKRDSRMLKKERKEQRERQERKESKRRFSPKRPPAPKKNGALERHRSDSRTISFD